jgi:hypothetical protein
MRLHRLATGLAVVALAACVTRTPPPDAYVSLTYTSNPAGALVKRGNRTLGHTPLTLNVRVPLEVAEAGGAFAPDCAIQGTVTFQWVSGAEASVSNPCVVASEQAAAFSKVPGAKAFRASVRISADRPTDVPGMKKDVDTAIVLASRRVSAYVPPMGLSAEDRPFGSPPKVTRGWSF